MTICAYATSAGADDDEIAPVLAAWREVGIEGRAERWDDPGVDWSAYDAVVIRSVWDYVPRREEFLAWARGAESVTRLLNSRAVLESNTDKTYLRDLDVPTVPTHWSSRGLPDWPEYVVKPAVSAGGRDTTRTTDRAEAQTLAAALEAAGRTPMVQPYLDMVESEGETSLLYFNGRFSHAVRRNPVLAPVLDTGQAAGEPRGSTLAPQPRTRSNSPRRCLLPYPMSFSTPGSTWSGFPAADRPSSRWS
ncbi:RimK family alpha-L-glutamate ligase [Nonomuraea antimicrobica]